MPLLMEWNKDLELQVNDMNNQHKHLLDLMNRLFELNHQKADKASLISALDALGKYTVQHFEEEEAYMESIEYPKLTVHKTIHKDLLRKFGEHQNEFITSSQAILDDKFFNFLQLWLKAHIMGIDKQYSDHSQAVKAA